MSSLFQQIAVARSEHGLRWVIRRAPGYVLEQVREQSHHFVHDRFSDRPSYWRLGRTYVNRSAPVDIRDFGAPIDPYDRLYVDPFRIIRKTHRNWYPIEYRKRLVGKVKSGTWDRSPIRLHDTDVYNGFVQHFEEGTPWENTALIKNADNPDQSRAKCEEWDDLYEQIRLSGYKTQRELLGGTDVSGLSRLKNRVSLDQYYREMSLPSGHRSTDVQTLQKLLDEVMVDIGRNGELLYVDGKHRLCIARLLGLDKIPVTVAYRHREWMKYRDELYANDKRTTWHPDIKKL